MAYYRKWMVRIWHRLCLSTKKKNRGFGSVYMTVLVISVPSHWENILYDQMLWLLATYSTVQHNFVDKHEIICRNVHSSDRLDLLSRRSTRTDYIFHLKSSLMTSPIYFLMENVLHDWILTWWFILCGESKISSNICWNILVTTTNNRLTVATLEPFGKNQYQPMNDHQIFSQKSISISQTTRALHSLNLSTYLLGSTSTSLFLLAFTTGSFQSSSQTGIWESPVSWCKNWQVLHHLLFLHLN